MNLDEKIQVYVGGEGSLIQFNFRGLLGFDRASFISLLKHPEHLNKRHKYPAD